MAGTLVRLDVGAVKKGFVLFNPGEGVADIRFAGADRFDLAPLQLHSGFEALEDVEITQRLAIENGLSGHSKSDEWEGKIDEVKTQRLRSLLVTFHFSLVTPLGR